MDKKSIVQSLKSNAKYYLGIDGGATKTFFVLCSESGKVIKTCKLGSSNPFDVGYEKAGEVLAEGVRAVAGEISNSQISCFAGLSGGATGDSKVKISKILSRFGFLSFSNGSDAENVIAAGLKGKNGIAVIMGTGSAAFAQKNGEVKRVGGLGYLFDHGGCGYDVGNLAIRAACMAQDGSGKPTVLLDMLKKDGGVNDILQLLPHYYLIGKEGVASYAPMVFKAFDQGDAVSREILFNCMERVAVLLQTGRNFICGDGGDNGASGNNNDNGASDNNVCYAKAENGVKLAEPTNAVFVGGLTKRFEVLQPFINEWLNKTGRADDYRLAVYNKNVACGALIKAGLSPEIEVDL